MAEPGEALEPTSDGSGRSLAAPGVSVPQVATPLLPEDWPAQAAERVEKLVGNVRDKTTGPALTVGRAVVYGLLAALLGVTALVLLTIGLVRLLVIALPEGDVWAAHLIVGGLFTLLGLLLWSKRRPSAD